MQYADASAKQIISEVIIKMKFAKILSAILAIIAVMTMFAACNPAGTGDETDPQGIGTEDTRPRHKALVHFKVLDHTGKEVYSTDEEEPYEYDSPFYEPTVLVFIEDFAFMNYKNFEYKTDSSKKISSISITKKKKTTTYSAGTEVTSALDGSKQKTFWVCLINGKEIASMEETVIQDGDTVVLRLAYYGSDKVTEPPKQDYTEPTASDTTA